MTGALRAFTIGLTAFLTVVDLFATQAILPALTRAYGVTPAAMGFAVNASTSYFLGGLVGSAVLGQVFDRLGWTAYAIGIGASLALGGLLAFRLEIRPVAASLAAHAS